eukprot:TRINITY_DN297_c3_g1_i1.p1 TRINITY_DN297_c3_g1~~TRINITY_DN297_c3_g1_i1.p1  ORF type:complete len:793 (+),score=262.77 TRINITY_DN297_c3_g1_i1:64-2442(+)
MIKQKKYDISRTNIANLGSELEKNIKKAASKHERAWRNVGTLQKNEEENIKIWRIENFRVKKWPEDKYGEFFNEDCYIVLYTYKKKSSNFSRKPDKICWNIHFWISHYTTADKAGTAAYKTVELDDFLNGEPVQYREAQGYESSLFLSYFSQFGGISILEGGTESGFNHIEKVTYRPRLLQIKGTDEIMVILEVSLNFSSINEGDSFILDAGDFIYVWNGKNANNLEIVKSGLIGRAMRDDRQGRSKVITLEQKDTRSNTVSNKNDTDEFWKYLGVNNVSLIQSSNSSSNLNDENNNNNNNGNSASNSDNSNSLITLNSAKIGGSDEEVNNDFCKLFRLTDGMPPPIEEESGEENEVRLTTKEEANILKKEMGKWFGSSTSTFVEILSKNKGVHKRESLEYEYKALTNKSLASELDKKTHGSVNKFFKLMFKSKVERDAYVLRSALSGLTTNHEIIILILGTSSNNHLTNLKKTYQDLYKTNLIDAIESKIDNAKNSLFSGHYFELLKTIMLATRDESWAIDEDEAAEDAQFLYSAGEGKFFGTDDEAFIDIFTSRSYKQLCKVFEKYDEISKKNTMIEAIEKYTKGYLKETLKLIYYQSQEQINYVYTSFLYEALQSFFCNEKVVFYILLNLSGNDINQLKAKFYALYGCTLTSYISKSFSGNTLSLLTAFIGKENISKYPTSLSTSSINNMIFEFVGNGNIDISMFDSSDVFIFDVGFQIFVWVGKNSSHLERKYALQFAQYYLDEQNKTNGRNICTPIAKVMEKGENELFYSLLYDYKPNNNNSNNNNN